MGKRHFDFLVVGAGLMGSAAARHIAAAGKSVAIVGPKEPDYKPLHNGVFASHYDQARITRKLDSDPDWARLSFSSIDRYAEIENATGITFFAAVGSVMAGPEHGEASDFIQNTAKVAAAHGTAHDVLRNQHLGQRFPYFDFPNGTLALHERSDAGWINPRKHVAAELAFSESLGAVVYETTVRTLVEENGGVVATCDDQTVLTASKVIVACGAFSKAIGLLPDPLPMKVFARTVAFFELDEIEARRLKDMPSVIYFPAGLANDLYVLPPVVYPDGKSYLKIGGDTSDVELSDVNQIKDWFRGDGDREVGRFLADQLVTLMPTLRYQRMSTGSCVTSFTRSTFPLIYAQTERMIALTGGNGAGAKCADELGRLATELTVYGKIPMGDYRTTFVP